MSCKRKICFCRQPKIKYLSRSKFIRQNQTIPESLDIYFCFIFDCHYQKLISGLETEDQVVSPTSFKINLQHFLFFQDPILSRLVAFEVNRTKGLMYQISVSNLRIVNQILKQSKWPEYYIQCYSHYFVIQLYIPLIIQTNKYTLLHAIFVFKRNLMA